MNEANDLTWKWTIDAMGGLKDLAEQFKQQAKNATDLQTKIAFHRLAKEATNGLKVVAEVFCTKV